MLASLLAVLMVVVAGMPIGYVVFRDLRFALLIAPLVTALSAAAAAILMLVVGGDLLWWLGPLLVLQWAATPVLLRRTAPPAVRAGTWADWLWLVVPLLLPFLVVVLPPTAWDANSIWWLHAAYFTKGATLAREYLGLPSVSFSHPDYPPLESAAVGAVWSVLSGYKLYVAQFVSAALSFSSIVMLGYAVRVATNRAPALVSRIAAACVALAAWGAEPTGVADGYSDVLWAAAFAAAAVLLLLRPEPLRRPLLPVLLLSGVALTKNEGFVMAVVLAATATVRMRRELRRAWVLWVPVLAGGVWSLVCRHFGAKSDVTSSVHLGDVLRLDPAIYDRLSPTLSAIWSTVGPLVAVAVATAVVGGILLRRQRRTLELGGDLWLWALVAVYLAVLSATYLVSSNPITWYLNTSITRVTLPFALVATASAVCWAVVALTGGGTFGGDGATIRREVGISQDQSQEISV
ncbi:hypothetical protein GCM10023322_53010 [Rugosimonospora acidiphila]|uniref:DUF2029 domain-containing protein n=1 Tax=Rugosimonospora acidiphila TaxID=556531 RepID=A0ABP9SA38_9ACTN